MALVFELNCRPLGTLFALHGVGEPHFVAHTPCFAFESSVLHAGPAAPVPPGVTVFPHVSRDRVFVYIVSSKRRGGLARVKHLMYQHNALPLRPGDGLIALRDAATQ